MAQDAHALEQAETYKRPAGLLAASLDALSRQAGVRTDASSELVDPPDTGAEQGDPPVPTSQWAAPSSESSTTDLEQVTVTGTRIRGGTSPSPVITIGAEHIREEGFTDLGDVIRSVPQNFSGGQNPGVTPFSVSGAGVQNTNLTGGSALNLRGLGPDASLTLLNGRRMAYGGISQAIDISAIPVEAVQRIEIVADGASAIYGSDAVGGVANVILRPDFDGVSLGARAGTATGGGMGAREYNAVAGGNWSGGGLMVAYKDVSTDPIHARQRDYTGFLHEAWTLYPQSDLRSGLVSVRQSLGDSVELHLEALGTRRSQMYSAHNSLGNQRIVATPESTTSLVAPGMNLFLPNDWELSFSAARTRDSLEHAQSIGLLATGDVFPIRFCYCNEGRVYEAGAEGPVFSLPGGQARLAVGAGHRETSFREYDHLANQPVIDGRERSRFAYAEMHLPLLGPAPDIDSARRLELTLAARAEDYDSFGDVTTPKVGLIYTPGRNVTLSTSWGRSFKAPTLFQLFRSEFVLYESAVGAGGSGFPDDATVLSLAGGNPALAPERARTWTASLAFHPADMPGLEAGVTWWAIDYDSRVVEPIPYPAQALSDPANAEFVRYFPTEAEQAALIARDSDGLLTNLVGTPYDPSTVVAIVRSHFHNAAGQRIRGLDLSGSYRFDVAGGQLGLRGSATWLDSTQRITTTETDLAGTLFHPPKVTGRIGAVWERGRLVASAFANYKGGVLNVVAGEKTSSFTTFDTTLRYAIPSGEARDRPRWDFSLSVQNALDRPPPLHDTGAVTAFAVPPYDATNYSAIGRYIDLSISKHW
ncbi:TonB-dependent receptor plug domain-containing protein [Luteimonas sp. A482]